MNWKRWKLGLVVALVIGFFTACAAGAVLDGVVINFKFVLFFLGLIGKDVVLYLKEHPATAVEFEDAKPKPPGMTLWLLLFAAAFALMVAGCSTFSNPTDFKPAAVAVGQDAVVVNAERIQETSLFAFQQLDEWEFANRAVLPKEVSRTVDQVRREFPENWQLSRMALDDYKAKRGPVTMVNQLTAALSAAQTAMMKFQGENDPAAQASLLGAIQSLARSIQILSK